MIIVSILKKYKNKSQLKQLSPNSFCFILVSTLISSTNIQNEEAA